MKFLLVDDEELALKNVKEAICEAVPDCEIEAFNSASKALDFFGKYKGEGGEPIEVAFLDIELGHTNGLVLAKQLKDIKPDIHIIFVTSFAKYALPAIQMHATGYLMKPANPIEISRELTFIYGEGKAKTTNEKNIRIQTFGGFAIFVDDELLTFKRQKAKELLACLVDRQGADITTRLACTLLWEDENYDRKMMSNFRNALSDLRATLRTAGVEKLLIKKHNSLAVDSTQFDCDSYNFIKGDPIAVNAYQGNYLSDYSWAEMMNANFNEKTK